MVASRPRSALTNRMSIHSEISKFDLPVRASMPRKPWKFSFAGRFEPPIPETVAFVTHGRFPVTSSEPRMAATSASQSWAKKSCWPTDARFAAPDLTKADLACAT